MKIDSTTALKEAIKEMKQCEKLTPLAAIKLKCLDCANYEKSEVKNCTIEDCPLYDFRLGKNPNRKRTMTEEQKKEAADRMNKARAAKAAKDTQN